MTEPLARIKVDEKKNCFGKIEWKAVREAASRFLPKHTAAAGSNALGLRCRTRRRRWPLAAQLWDWWRLKRVDAWLPSKCQAAFLGSALVTLQKYSACKQNTQPSCRESPVGLDKLTRADDPRHALPKNGGLADLYMDDGDFMCRPILVPS